MPHMTRMTPRTLCPTLAVVLLACGVAGAQVREPIGDGGAAPRTASAELAQEYRHLRELHGGAIVTIKYVQKTEANLGEFEGQNEIPGVMVSPEGVVLCSNLMLAGRGGRSTPRDIKVLVGDAQDGLDAQFIARDTELDLAWLRIKSPGDRKFACIDLAAAAKSPVRLSLGERVLGLGMMGRYFGQELLVTEAYVAGKTHKPRELYVIRGSLDTDPAMPVFTADGQVAGFACVQSPDPDEVTGNYGALVARGRGLILPVESVAKATRRALESAEPAQPDVQKAAKSNAEKSTEKGPRG